MRFQCKYCKQNMTGNVIQIMINDIILSGKKYIKSDGTEAKYQVVANTCCTE